MLSNSCQGRIQSESVPVNACEGPRTSSPFFPLQVLLSDAHRGWRYEYLLNRVEAKFRALRPHAVRPLVQRLSVSISVLRPARPGCAPAAWSCSSDSLFRGKSSRHWPRGCHTTLANSLHRFPTTAMSEVDRITSQLAASNRAIHQFDQVFTLTVVALPRAWPFGDDRHRAHSSQISSFYGFQIHSLLG